MVHYAQISDLHKAAPTIMPAIIHLPSGDTLSDDVLNDALRAATGRINGRISSRYPKPFDVIPDILKDLCVDIAIYFLARDHGRLSDNIEQRYKDAMVELKDIAAGKADLPFEHTEGYAATDDEQAEAEASEAWFEAPEKLTGRDRLKGF